MSDPTLFDLDDASTPPGPTARVRLTIAYDGTDFRGLAPNAGVRTVVGELVRVLTPLLGVAPEIVMSGRTDAGVHAAHQVLSFDVPVRDGDDAGSTTVEAADGGDDEQGAAGAGLDTERIVRVINARLAPEVVALDAAVVADDFSARFDAIGRRYRYTIRNTPVPDPFSARTAWWVPEPLELAVMRLACDPFLGEHDFSSFCRRPKTAPGEEPASLVRRIDHAQWTDTDDGFLHFDIAGSAFCHQMVRSIVGFHVAVGRGKRSAGEVRAVIEARDRRYAEQPAPPHGLTLVQVRYP